tara:strand:+ start:4009 stop:4272 length:264 start_codon:yes stop_codon:yes gene_type:complete
LLINNKIKIKYQYTIMCVLSYVKKLYMINDYDITINENIDIEYLQMISSINNQKYNFNDLIIITTIIMGFYGYIYFIFSYFKIFQQI